MGQVLQQDIIATLVKTGNRSLSMGPSIITIGGQQYRTYSDIVLDTLTLGLGGIDAGLWETEKHYYVYAVVVPTYRTVSLIASLSDSHPEGYNSYRKVGDFYTTAETYISQLFKKLTIMQTTQLLALKIRFNSLLHLLMVEQMLSLKLRLIELVLKTLVAYRPFS